MPIDRSTTPSIESNCERYLPRHTMNSLRNFKPLPTLCAQTACKSYYLEDMPADLRTYERCPISRRNLLHRLGAAAAGSFCANAVFGQGRCRDGYGTRMCPL